MKDRVAKSEHRGSLCTKHPMVIKSKSRRSIRVPEHYARLKLNTKHNVAIITKEYKLHLILQHTGLIKTCPVGRDHTMVSRRYYLCIISQCSILALPWPLSIENLAHPQWLTVSKHCHCFVYLLWPQKC